MIRQLNIRNFALAENLKITFRDGLNILTGETGAGKSILVNAIGAVLGERVYTEVVRTGFDKAVVEAAFDISESEEIKALLEEKGLECSDDLLLRREISTKSSSRAFVNDSQVTVATLSSIGNLLMDIHGQHEHQTLLRKETHRPFLDAFARLGTALERLSTAYETATDSGKALRKLRQQQSELEEKHELFSFQNKEIEEAALEEGEEENLVAERKLLSNSEKIFSLTSQLTQIFSEDEVNLLQLSGEATQALESIGEYTTELGKLFEEFKGARIVLEEAARQVESFQNSLEFNPERLETVESRLNQISQLKKKYGASIAEVLAYQQEIQASLRLKENYDDEIVRLEKQFEADVATYCQEAERVSAARGKAASKMQGLVQEQLEKLGMSRMRFEARLSRQEDANGLYRKAGHTYFADENGFDMIEFFISPNPGEDYRPLVKIASGGEISRIMLALKTILAEIDKVPSLLFDEIDAGISGRIAQAVGQSIHFLSNSHQIICITHLPQIASYGTSHYSVEKYVEGERTFTRIHPLDEEQRVVEVARLMAGANISDTVLQSARQLIAEGRS